MNKIYVSALADDRLTDYLSSTGHRIEKIRPMADIDPAIASHPDIYMCKLGDKVFHGSPGELSRDYPGHAIYNGCSTGRFFIHNLKITSPGLLKAVAESGQRTVNVMQGYAKCSCVVVDENSIITYDRGIEKAALSCGMDVLLISPGQVLLPGYPYGFLGGASGRVGNKIVFNGDLSSHSDFSAICDFIENRGLETVYFSQYPLTDIGSVIEEGQQ